MTISLPAFLEKASKIKAFLFDVDGVFTDGTVTVLSSGEVTRTMYTRDGYALQYAIKQGYEVAIITGGICKTIPLRFKSLGIPEENIFLGVKDKKPVFENFLKVKNIPIETTFYMGDDLPDLPVLEICGLSAAPQNAAYEILEKVDFISQYEGGKGCVREILEKILQSQNKWSMDRHIASF